MAKVKKPAMKKSSGKSGQASKAKRPSYESAFSSRAAQLRGTQSRTEKGSAKSKASEKPGSGFAALTQAPSLGRSALGRGLSALMSSTLLAPQLSTPVSVHEEPQPTEKLPPSLLITGSEFEALADVVTKPLPVDSEVAFEARSALSGPSDGSLASQIEVSRIQMIPKVVSPAAYAPRSDSAEQLLLVPLERLRANPHQPRKQFNQAELETLANSIRESGLLQPILVRRKAEMGSRTDLEIVAGERRFRAAQIAGLAKVPVIIRDLSDRETLELGIVENIQRADLNPVEEALAFRRLVEEFGQTHAEIAKAVGLERASVANALRLLKLPSDLLEMLSDGRLSAGHGRALLMLEDEAAQRDLAQRILGEKLSVRAAEALASANKPKLPRVATEKVLSASKSPAVLDVEERLRRALGTKVSLTIGEQGAGELRLSFFTEAELNELLRKLGA